MDLLRRISETEPLGRGTWKYWGGDVMATCPRCGAVRVLLGEAIQTDGTTKMRCPSNTCLYEYVVRLDGWGRSVGATDALALLVAFFCSLLLIACHHNRKRENLQFILTPQGYRCAYRDEGTILSGKATIEQIWAWHSQAVDRAVRELAALGRTPEAEIRRKAQSVAYRLVDNCAYEVEGSGVWATGRWVDYLNTVEVCLYTRVQGTKDQIPESAPPWTVRQNPRTPSEWRWGVLLAGREFPALRHELGHALYGPEFEH